MTQTAIRKPYILKDGLDNNNNRIINIAEPVGLQDAATLNTLTNSGTIAAVANKFVKRDSNANAVVNNLSEGYATIVTSSGITTLTAAAAYQQTLTGSLGHTVQLPVTNTLQIGTPYYFVNQSTHGVNLDASDMSAVAMLAPGTSAILTCTSTTNTTSAAWQVVYAGAIVANCKSLTIDNTLVFQGTDHTTHVFPSTSSVLARTDAANTFEGIQTMTSPVFLVNPVAPTQDPGTSNATLATTEFVTNALSGLIGGSVYQGVWNAATNTPALTSGVGTKGWFYKVNVAGTTTVDGISQWTIGDIISFDGTTWDKIDGISSEVLSVAGRTGSVVLSVTDISGAAPLNSPEFVTPTLGVIASGDLSNGTGVASGLTAGNVITNANLDGDVTSVGNTTTLTNSAVIGQALSGYAAGAGVVTGEDSIIEAIEKLDGNIQAIVSEGALVLANGYISSATVTAITTTADQVALQLPIAQYRSAKITIQMTCGSSYHETDITLLQDGTNVYMQENGDLYTGSPLSTFDAALVSGNMQLLVNPANAATVYKMVYTAIAI